MGLSHCFAQILLKILQNLFHSVFNSPNNPKTADSQFIFKFWIKICLFFLFSRWICFWIHTLLFVLFMILSDLEFLIIFVILWLDCRWLCMEDISTRGTICAETENILLKSTFFALLASSCHPTPSYCQSLLVSYPIQSDRDLSTFYINSTG